MSDKCVPRECFIRVSDECPARVSDKSVLQSDESVARECPTRAFYRSVSCKGVETCLGVCFWVCVCIRLRGFHLFYMLKWASFCAIISPNTENICVYTIPYPLFHIVYHVIWSDHRAFLPVTKLTRLVVQGDTHNVSWSKVRNGCENHRGSPMASGLIIWSGRCWHAGLLENDLFCGRPLGMLKQRIGADNSDWARSAQNKCKCYQADSWTTSIRMHGMLAVVFWHSQFGFRDDQQQNSSWTRFAVNRSNESSLVLLIQTHFLKPALISVIFRVFASIHTQFSPIPNVAW